MVAPKTDSLQTSKIKLHKNDGPSKPKKLEPKAALVKVCTRFHSFLLPPPRFILPPLVLSSSHGRPSLRS